MTRATRRRRSTPSNRASHWTRRSAPRWRPISPISRSTKHLLAHKGIRGLVVCCDECQQDHYHDWDMLRANLLQLLVDGTVRPHEPAYDPEPDAYVTWDYCRGYADASLNEATSEPDGYR